MADVQHKDLATADCHEPKLISATTTGDAGKVLTPSSTVAGTSQLRKLKPSELDYADVDHINIEIIGNTTPDAIVIAGDLTLHTSADYDVITRFTEDLDNAKSGFTFNNSTGEMTFAQTGTYKLHAWLSVSSDTITTLFGMRYGIAGDYFPEGTAPVAKGTASAVGDIIQLSIDTEIVGTVAEVLTIGIASNKGVNLTIHEAGLVLRRVK